MDIFVVSLRIWWTIAADISLIQLIFIVFTHCYILHMKCGQDRQCSCPLRVCNLITDKKQWPDSVAFIFFITIIVLDTIRHRSANFTGHVLPLKLITHNMVHKNNVRNSLKNIKVPHGMNSMWLVINKKDYIFNYEKVMSLHSRSNIFL